MNRATHTHIHCHQADANLGTLGSPFSGGWPLPEMHASALRMSDAMDHGSLNDEHLAPVHIARPDLTLPAGLRPEQIGQALDHAGCDGEDECLQWRSAYRAGHRAGLMDGALLVLSFGFMGLAALAQFF